MDEQLRFILLLGLIPIFAENTGAFAICMFSETEGSYHMLAWQEARRRTPYASQVLPQWLYNSYGWLQHCMEGLIVYFQF
jgi:hypothetical protein